MDSAGGQAVVEHVVLFRAREGVERAATEAWAEAGRALARLEGVLHLYVGAVACCKPDGDVWSIALYGRYRDKAALEAYSVHPQHLQLVALGSTLFSDLMALDWEAHLNPSFPSSTLIPSSSAPSALRVIFLQWKQNCLHADIASWFQDWPCSTSGPNFSPARARNFEWGFASLHQHEDVLQEDYICLQMLSDSSSVEKFLIVDVDLME